MSLDVMKQALELLESAHVATDLVWKRYDCITALRAAIEQAEKQEPVAWTTMPDDEDWLFISGTSDPNGMLDGKWNPLYTAPRQWQGLTDEDREEILRWIEWKETGSQPIAPQKLIAYVERKLREKNNG